jgi:hypothetical protein
LQSAETKRTASAAPLSPEAVMAIANVERELAKDRQQAMGESGVDLLMLGFRALDHLLAH